MKHKTVRKTKKYNNTKKRRNRNKIGGAEDEECSICYEPLNEDNKVTTQCGHNFHKECILQTCKVMYWKKNNICLCPLCRSDIDTSMKNFLPPEEQIDSKHLTLETFPLYINNMLSVIPEENPDDTLLDLLLSFDGTDDLPIDVHDPLFDDENRQVPNIMQFKKMHVATRLTDRKPLYVYYFEGFVNKLPFKLLRRNKKYYAFVLDDDGITELETVD
jgi:hypothetical protein